MSVRVWRLVKFVNVNDTVKVNLSSIVQSCLYALCAANQWGCKSFFACDNQLPRFMYANSNGFEKTVHLCRLVPLLVYT